MMSAKLWAMHCESLHRGLRDGFYEFHFPPASFNTSDLEQTFASHGGPCLITLKWRLDQIFFMRPVPGWARYRTPIENLYLCGSGTHPGGGITGLPGYYAAKKILQVKPQTVTPNRAR